MNSSTPHKTNHLDLKDRRTAADEKFRFRYDCALVSCSSRKLSQSAPATDLYTSPLFTAAKAIAESLGVPWFVLSAKHGLVHPATVLEPYDLSLARLPADRRVRWATSIAHELQSIVPRLSSILVLADSTYCRAVSYAFHDTITHIDMPLDGIDKDEMLIAIARLAKNMGLTDGTRRKCRD